MDSISTTGKYIVLPNSPIEFTLTGPSGGRDRILVKSENAGLDLIGLASQPGPHPYRRPSSDIVGVMFAETRPLNVVSSFPLADIVPYEDSRSSKFGFAWKGYASRMGTEHVEEIFNKQIPDLQRAIRDNDLQEIEWALAPVIYSCSRANEHLIRRRRMLWTFIGFYAVSTLSIFLYWVAINILKSR